MYLYLYHKESFEKKNREGADQPRSDFSEQLIRSALKDYLWRQPGAAEIEPEKIRILKEEKGKPYLVLTGEGADEILPVHFSVSHSGCWWGCLMAAEPVGFDLEVCREKVNYEKIADRFFAKEESEYIKSRGSEAFYKIWVRKEAFVKFLGTGLAEGLDSFSVISEASFGNRVFAKDKPGRVRLSGTLNSCDVHSGVEAAYCSESGSLMKEIITL